MVELYRYNPDNGKWKRVSVEKSNGAIFLRASEGMKGNGDSITITLRLTEQEVAYLATALLKMLWFE